MNTQIHMIFGAAALGSPLDKKVTAAALIGGILPDIAMFFLIPIAMIMGFNMQELWGKDGIYYTHEGFKTFMAIFNSIPVWLLISLIGFWIRKPWLTALALSAALHALFDFGLHYDDGHPHFWPFSDWVFQSPVSYWDPAHYGKEFLIFEVCFTILLLIFIAIRWTGWLFPTSMLILALIGYIPMIYWSITHH